VRFEGLAESGRASLDELEARHAAADVELRLEADERRREVEGARGGAVGDRIVEVGKRVRVVKEKRERRHGHRLVLPMSDRAHLRLDALEEGETGRRRHAPF